ncbi:MAG: (d)CMP kinase [Rhodospirillales bacterium]|jgi:CMP/dCMP kinase|nr:(d)CMP kinase [Rhodospirillales bacterium]
MIIAVDGPAGAGKGSLCAALEEHFGFARLDTGLLYRAVGMKVLRGGGHPEDAAVAEAAAHALEFSELDDPELRSDQAGQAASQVGAVPGVRAALLDFQRDFASNPPGGAKGSILDGRDIGTAVCPEAEAKLFITAPLDVRAQRRYKELQSRGHEAIYATVFEDMKKRDERDSGRADAPMAKADDAYLLDTGDMSISEVVAAALQFIESKTK